MDQKKITTLVLLWLITIVFLVVMAALFPANIVFGTASTSKFFAAILNGLILTTTFYFVPTVAKKLDIKLNGEKGELVAFFSANLVVIWGLKRMSEATGFGVSSILFVIILAVLLAILQFKVKKFGPKIIK